MMIRIAIALMLFATPVLAQQQQSPLEQALSQKIMQEINTGLACSTQLIEAKKQLETAEARIKHLEETVKPPPKTQ